MFTTSDGRRVVTMNDRVQSGDGSTVTPRRVHAKQFTGCFETCQTPNAAE